MPTFAALPTRRDVRLRRLNEVAVLHFGSYDVVEVGVFEMSRLSW